MIIWGLGTFDLHTCQWVWNLNCDGWWMLPSQQIWQKKSYATARDSFSTWDKSNKITVIHNMPGANSRVLWGSMTGRGDMCCCAALGYTVHHILCAQQNLQDPVIEMCSSSKTQRMLWSYWNPTFVGFLGSTSSNLIWARAAANTCEAETAKKTARIAELICNKSESQRNLDASTGMHTYHEFNACAYIHMSIYIYLSVCLSVYLSIHLSIYLSIHLSMYIYIHLSFSLSLSLFPSMYVPISIYIYLHSEPYMTLFGWPT